MQCVPFGRHGWHEGQNTCVLDMFPEGAEEENQKRNRGEYWYLLHQLSSRGVGEGKWYKHVGYYWQVDQAEICTKNKRMVKKCAQKRRR